MNLFKYFTSISILFLLAFSSCKSTSKTAKRSDSGVSYGTQKEFNDHYYEGAKLKILGDYNGAVKEFKLALNAIPTNHDAMYQLGNILFKDKKYEESIHWSEKAISNNPEYNFWYYGQLAQIYSVAKLYDKSAATFAKMVEKEPGRKSSYEEAGNQYLNARKPKEAIKYFEKSITRFGPEEELCRKLELLYFDMDQPSDAIRTIRKLSDSSPGDIKFLGLLAETLTKANKISEAKEVYKRILILDDNNGYACFGMADILRQEGKYDESFIFLSNGFSDKRVNIQHKLKVISSYYFLITKDEKSKSQALELSHKIIESHPEDATAYQVYSDVLWAAGDMMKSRDYLKKSLIIDGKDIRIWQKLFGLDLKLNQTRYLYDDSKMALELFATQPGIYIINSQAALNLKLYDTAIEVATNGLDISFKPEEKVQLNLTIGDAWFEKSDFEKSDKHFNKALEIDPDDALVLNNYAYNLFKRNQQLEKAEAMVLKALKKEPNSGSYADTYGCVLMALGKYTEAEQWIKKSLDWDGENPEVLEHLGDLYVKQGNNKSAVEAYKKALKLDPNNKSIEIKIGKLG